MRINRARGVGGGTSWNRMRMWSRGEKPLEVTTIHQARCQAPRPAVETKPGWAASRLEHSPSWGRWAGWVSREGGERGAESSAQGGESSTQGGTG